MTTSSLQETFMKPEKDIHQQIEHSYDEIPYQSHAFSESGPVHIASIARLFGLDVVDITQAKVLELGCAMGGNLIPHAINNPKSQYVGLDLSKQHIDIANQKIKDLGLKNIRFEQLNILDIDAKLGMFDYIIAHGVYSWVPGKVRDAILQACQKHLSPKGLAFISYNTYPGWKTKEIVRDAMLLRGNTQNTGPKRLSHARGMVNFLQDMSAKGSLMHTIVEQENKTVKTAAAHYLLHEYLETVNEPCYFKDFAAHLNQFELSYIAEAEPHTMFVSNLGQEVANMLLGEVNGDQILLEQYMDFLKNRQFRQSIVSHQANARQLRYQIRAEDLKAFEFAGFFASEAAIDFQEAGPSTFKNARGAQISVSQSIEKAALVVLHEANPASINFKQILEGAQKKIDSKLPVHSDILLSLLEQLIIRGFLRFSLTAQKPCKTISENPKVSPLVQYDAKHQADVGVTNAWHESISLNLIQQHILPLMDGSKTQADLIKHIADLAKKNLITFNVNGVIVQDPAQFDTLAAEHVTQALELTKSQALLIA